MQGHLATMALNGFELHHKQGCLCFKLITVLSSCVMMTISNKDTLCPGAQNGGGPPFPSSMTITKSDSSKRSYDFWLDTSNGVKVEPTTAPLTAVCHSLHCRCMIFPILTGVFSIRSFFIRVYQFDATVS